MSRHIVSLLTLALVAGCGGKNANKNEPLVGWHKESDDWAAACYYPPNYDAMGPGDRKIARSDTLRELMKQWSGEKNAAVDFDDDHVMSLETVLLGQPDDIEQVAIDNLERCKGAMVSGGDTSSWGRWLRGVPAKLTAGQCTSAPLDYTLFDYLDIGKEWQIPAKVCFGDDIEISGSRQDYFRLSDDGPWINLEGDKDQPALGGELPCNFEGCYRGQLIMRFTGDSGVVQVFPVGLHKSFQPPEHGQIEVMINDDTWFDNKYKIEGSIEHHASIEYDGDH